MVSRLMVIFGFVLRSTNFSLELVADNRFNNITALQSAVLFVFGMRIMNFNIHVLPFFTSLLISAVVCGVIGLLEWNFFTSRLVFGRLVAV